MKSLSHALQSRVASFVFLVMMCSSTVLSPIALVSCTTATPIKDTQAGRDAEAVIKALEAIEARQKSGEVVLADELAKAKADADKARADLAAEKAKSEAEDAKVDAATGTITAVVGATQPLTAAVPWGPLIAAQVPTLMGLVGLVVKEFTGHRNNVDNISWLEKRLDDAEKKIQASAVAAGPVTITGQPFSQPPWVNVPPTTVIT